MMKIRTFFIMDFTIFAVLVLLQSILHQVGFISDFDSVIVLQYFIVSSLLAVMQLLMDTLIRFKSTFRRMLSSIVGALAIVFLIGGTVMHWFSFTTKWILLTLALTVIIDTVLFLITGMLSARHAAEQINNAIRRRKEAEKQKND